MLLHNCRGRPYYWVEAHDDSSISCLADRYVYAHAIYLVLLHTAGSTGGMPALEILQCRIECRLAKTICTKIFPLLVMQDHPSVVLLRRAIRDYERK